jgi:protein-tyrosine kinase
MNPELTQQVHVLSEMAEMKRIYASLEASLPALSPRCLVLTSAARGEGKTLTAAALAVVAATQTKKRVLAVDLNWYAPSLHLPFGLDLAFDTRALQSEGAIMERVLPSGVDRLDVLVAPKPAPPGNGAAGMGVLLGEEIMRQAVSAYDLVIVDSSAIFPTNRYMMDPVVLARGGDGVLMVVLANVTTRQLVKRAYTHLKSSGARVLGVAVNHWKNDLS